MTARSGDHITSGTRAWGSCAARSALSEESTGGWRRLGNDLRMQQRPQHDSSSRPYVVHNLLWEYPEEHQLDVRL